MAMKSIIAIQFCCYFFVEQQRFVLYDFVFVRKIVTTPLLFFLFRFNIMHLTDTVSWGKLNHLMKFFNSIT